ncbi:hypothetical protein [Herbaspirillum huttiense]|uniref:PH domain-containing protein n=1 Tax=Herbaspirillum huttiense subsp. lycopersici TaxID=3074428 RepID=A0ABU2EKL4_9BURK|nr:hypothetical protein [Herbaspirillum huttiense]MDR9848687.1 hypothetical protein [Herbaspirillum huttiense SE1]
MAIYLLYRRNFRLRRAHLAGIPNFNGTQELDAGSHLVAFDMDGKRLAFSHPTGVRVFAFAELAHIEWTWNVRRNGSKTDNYLNFRLNNIETPLVKVRCNTAGQAEHWLAKIQAILAS